MKINDKNYELPFVFGIKQSKGSLEIGDFATGHMAIFGKSGSGKSCTLNGLIQSSMMFNNPMVYVMIDFKRVELSQYEDFKNVAFIDEQNKFLKLIKWLEIETDNRLKKFKKCKAKKLQMYNSQVKQKLPFILVVIDEIATISLNNNMVDENGKKININDKLADLINKTRAAGIFFVLATQKCNNDSIDTNVRSQIETFVYHYFNKKDVRNLGLTTNISKLKVGEFFIENKNYNCNERFTALFINDEKDENGNYKFKNGNINYEKLKKVLE